MLRIMVWPLIIVCVWSVPVPLKKIFSSSTSPNMSSFTLIWKFSAYACTNLSVLSSFMQYFACDMSVFWLVSSSRLALSGTRITPSADSVLCIRFSSTVTLSSDTDMTSNGMIGSDSNFVKGAVAMRAHTVICAINHSTKMLVPSGAAARIGQFCRSCGCSGPGES